MALDSSWDQTIEQVLSKNAPANPAGCTWTTEPQHTQIWKASIQTRGIIYTGPCNPSAVSGSATALNITNETLGIALGGSGNGGVLGIFSNILQHHAQAVAREQATVCAVSQTVSITIPQIDDAVSSGQLYPKNAIDAMTNLVLQMKQQLQGILSGCNAACCYIALLNAHLDFAKVYYMTLSPRAVLASDPGTHYAQSPASLAYQRVDSSQPPPGSPVSMPPFPWAIVIAGGIAIVGFVLAMGLKR